MHPGLAVFRQYTVAIISYQLYLLISALVDPRQAGPWDFAATT